MEVALLCFMDIITTADAVVFARLFCSLHTENTLHVRDIFAIIRF